MIMADMNTHKQTERFLKGNRSITVVMALLMLLFSSSSWSAQRVLSSMMTLYAGESKVLDAPGVTRISVGKVDLVSATLLQNNEVVLIAESEGETNMQFWFEDGHRETVAVVVVESNGWRQALEVKALLKDIPGVRVTTVGRRIVVDGNIQLRDLERVKVVKERYPDILILSREVTDYEQKMLYFDVQVTEINRDVTEELGINWSKSFAGPSLGYEQAYKTNSLGAMIDNANGVTPVAAGNLSEQGNEFFYFGINTSLVSMINLLEQTGAAITLSQPRLSARSGGNSTLTVGGEVPVVTSSVSGQSVSYKDYGIILGVEPKLDMYNNIVARVSVSVSQLDLANAVDGQPAFKKRYTENDIRLKPGETLALSGLITREEQLAYSGLKWLSDIPVFGHLFKSKSFNKGETELVILITPQIIDDLTLGENKQLVNRAQELVDSFEKTVDELME